jgi:3-methyladenine DNA glycosylase AlkD
VGCLENRLSRLENRLSRLEDRASGIAAERQAGEKLRRARAVMRMVLDEFARLKASGGVSLGDPLAQAVRNVAAAQYADLGEETYENIAEGWIETLREWTRLDWMVKAGRNGPPHA